MRPELNDVLQCLSVNSYSVFSLFDDVLDPRIKLLREGVERDAASICVRLLNHNPVSAWALGFAQATMMTLPLWNNNVVSPGLSSGVAWISTGGPERFLNMGRVLCYSEYLEGFLAQIDTPRVDDFRIEYLAHEIQATQLTRFLDRTEHLKLDQFTRTRGNVVKCILLWGSQTNRYMRKFHAHGDNVDSTEIMYITDWLPFFSLFSAVKKLHLSGGIAAYIVSALDDPDNSGDDEMDNEAGDKPVESIERFLAIRQLDGFPVTVVDTEDEFYRS
ncbi:hypothetical protein EDB85DRAFT_2147164 [Lactarius pseudohatsudake]|nr:hypothetical protein EDB85DRAFT_2147164 [Lactarius pseudohatsudake]